MNPFLLKLDSSKIQTYMECPRKFFFSNYVGLQQSEPSVDLVFGVAWHEAMAALLDDKPLEGYSNITPAIMAFSKYWEENSEGIDTHKHKNPENALFFLSSYVDWWSDDKFTVVETEQSVKIRISKQDFSVDIFANIDAVCNDGHNYFILEHKTTGRWVTQTYLNQWRQKPQTLAYFFYLQNSNIASNDSLILHNILCTSARNNDKIFHRMQSSFSHDQINSWILNTQHYVEQIMSDIRNVESENPDDNIMKSFPKNTTQCSFCPYIDVCMARPNPLKKLDKIPSEFDIAFWDPETRKTYSEKELS